MTNETYRPAEKSRRIVLLGLAILLVLGTVLPYVTDPSFAAFSGKKGSQYTVTDGGRITYGSGEGGYSNSRKCDLGDDLGNRYSYCVQPSKASPGTGTVTVDKVVTDENDTGTETDPSDKGTDDADTVEVNGSGGEGTETGNGSAEDLETQTMGTEDEPGSLSTGEEPDAEIDLDDKNQTGGEETQPGTTDAADKEDSGSTETAERAADDEKAATETGTETGKDSDKTSDESTSEKGKSDKDDTEDSTSEEPTDSSEDTYTSDSSPKTGDSFPVQVILVMLSSLCALTGIAVRQLLKRNPEDA